MDSPTPELLAWRATGDALSGLLDDLGIPISSTQEGTMEGTMLAVVQRFGVLSNEVRQLRATTSIPDVARQEQERRIAEVRNERDRAQRLACAHGTVINELRRRLGVGLGTSDARLPQIVSDLQYRNIDAHRAQKDMADTIREVRVALKVDAATPDSELGKVAGACRAGSADAQAVRLLDETRGELNEVSRVVADADGGPIPATFDELHGRVRRLAEQVSRFHRVLIGLGLPSEYWSETASREELFDLIDQVADNSDAWLALSPDRLACALHNAFVERRQQIDGPRFEDWWREWKPESSPVQAEMVGFATTALRELDVQPGRVASPEHLAAALFEASREVSKKLGSEPMPIIEKSSWDGASGRRKAWWRAVARRTLDRVFVMPSQSLLPVTPEELARAMFENQSVTVLPWEQAAESSRNELIGRARKILDALPSFAADKSVRVTPVQLARAMHMARCAATSDPMSRPPLFLGVSWEKLDTRSRDWFTHVAEIGLSELPEIARTDAEADARFESHMDATVAELQRENAEHVKNNARLVQEKGVALNALRAAAKALTMSFGDSDDAEAIGGTVTASIQQLRDGYHRLERENAQLLEAGNDANTDMLAYRGKVLFALGRLGVPLDVADAAPATFEAVVGAQVVRLEDVRFNFCVPRPEDWRVLLTPVRGPGIQREVRSGAVLDLVDAGEFVATLDYIGDLPKHPDGRLVLPSVSAEELGRAWFEGDLSLGIRWEDMPRDVQEAYGFHAKRVIERLSARPQSWTGLARSMRKEGLAFAPGTFFVRDETRTLMARAFKVDEQTIGDAVSRLTGDGLTACANPDHAALLAQLQEMGRHVEKLEAQKRRRDERLMRLREITGLAGSTEDELMDSIAGTYADFNARIPMLIDENQALRAEAEKFQLDMAAALGVTMLGGDARQALLAQARELNGQLRAHRSCMGAEALEREHAEQLAEALNMDGGPKWTWTQLVNAARASRTEMGRLRRELADYAQDLSRALGLSSGETWEDMIEIVTGQTSKAEPNRLAANALAEICRILDLNERTFPSAVVDAVSSVWSSWQVMEEWYPRVIEALGVTIDTSFDQNIPSAAGKALDKIRELRAAAVVEPGEFADVKRVRDAAFTVLEAAGIRVGIGDPVEVVVQKAGDAAAILRSWPDVLRGLSAFDIAEPDNPDEVEPMLEEYAKTYHFAGRYQAVLHNLEILLATVSGQPKRFDDATLKQRWADLVTRLFAPVLELGRAYGRVFDSGESKAVFADAVLMRVRDAVALSPDMVHTALADQVAFRLERLAGLPGDADDADFLVIAEDLPLHRHTLRQAAVLLRAHAAALASGKVPHPLVMALQSGTFWAPDSTVSDLELVPGADGGVMLRENTSEGGPFRVLAVELAPVGAALLMLAAHHAREAARERSDSLSDVRLAQFSPAQDVSPTPVSTMDDMLAPVVAAEKIREAAEIAAGAEEVLAVGSIRVTPRMPERWCYGPNSIDPDPGKRWHIGCGGEVQTFDGVDICGDCKNEQWDETELPPAAAPEDDK